jgi:RNA polymerase sigma-70 factor (ECF subfamily)
VSELGWAAARGDDEALAALVRTYHDRVHRFGMRACRDAFDAFDAVQEAFIQLSKRPEIAATPGVLSWLFTVVKHTCLRMLRPFMRKRERLDGPEAAESLSSSGLSPEAALARFELVAQVHRALAALAPEQREILILRDLEGLSGAEVSQALGLSEAAMKSRLHRARAALRAALPQGLA